MIHAVVDMGKGRKHRILHGNAGMGELIGQTWCASMSLASKAPSHTNKRRVGSRLQSFHHPDKVHLLYPKGGTANACLHLPK